MIQVKLVNHTPNPELAVAAAARACISTLNYEALCAELGHEDVQRILRIIIEKNHHSPLEHASFTFAISGVTRVLTHQLVRHRIASHSQLSQQRTDSSRLQFTTPPEIQQHPELAEEYQDIMKRCQELYRRFVRCGISRGSARYVLPSAFNTRIVTTMNARSLLNLLAQRECEIEDWEFREVALLMHSELMRVAPGIFQFAGPLCVTRGHCPEGEKGLKCSRHQVIALEGTRREEVESQSQLVRV
jgi:thymidylate synthase (FAD)